MNDPSIDVVTVATALFAVWLGPRIAVYAGPYFVILMGAFLGAMIALRRRPASLRWWSAPTFVFFCVLGSVLCTVAVCEIASEHSSATSSRYLLAPVSIILAGLGDDGWGSVAKWGANIARRVAERWLGRTEEKQ